MSAPSAAEAYLELKRQAFEPELERCLAALLRDVPAPLAEAMRYGVLGGGKRLRPALAMAAAEAVGKAPAPASAIQYGCAVEMIHAYSLIHDDLPAMDDDDLRRGRPTTHRAFGEAMAILAGDGLLTEAFTVIAALPDPLGAALCRELALGAGAVGMVGGQALDIAATGNGGLPAAEIERIHRGKTGALMAAAAAGGALCGGASPELAGQLRRYGEALGMAFQAADDLLDVVGDPTQRGKRQGGDEVEEKATLARSLGVEGARARAKALAEAACDAVASLEGSQILRDLALYAANRSR